MSLLPNTVGTQRVVDDFVVHPNSLLQRVHVCRIELQGILYQRILHQAIRKMLQGIGNMLQSVRWNRIGKHTITASSEMGEAHNRYFCHQEYDDK